MLPVKMRLHQQQLQEMRENGGYQHKVLFRHPLVCALPSKPVEAKVERRLLTGRLQEMRLAVAMQTGHLFVRRAHAETHGHFRHRVLNQKVDV